MPEHSIESRQPHPPEWREDLNPRFMQGQSTSRPAVDTVTDWPTAYDVKAVHRVLSDLSDADLKAIPVLPEGTRLMQGSVYVDLLAAPRRELTATNDMEADAPHAYAPKSQVPYEVWNRLLGDSAMSANADEEAARGETA
jgi:hypothetical protein